MPEPATGPGPPPQDDVAPVRFGVGHYYSPMYDARELIVEPARSRIWPAEPHEQPGIDWNGEAQRAFLREVCAPQERLAFDVEGEPDGDRYYTLNDQYPPLDAWALEAILRHARPRTIIEVGSGFSSLLTARVNREQLGGEARFVCVEPYPREFLLRGVEGISELLVERVEHVDLRVFESLRGGDVLFVDTSHVVRTGNDVVWIYGQILPRLAPGVLVHIHDVFLPGDYPEQWVREGWGWNENYLVEAFLQFNSGYRILLAAQWALLNARREIDLAFPRFAHSKEKGGGALWLRRT